MTVEPKVSVLVSALDEEERLPRLLRALEELEAPWPVEVVLVDNGSRDATPRIMREYAERSRHRVKVLRVEGTLAEAYNAAMDAAEGEYLAISAADEVPARRWLVEIVGSLEEGGFDAVLGPVIYYPEGRRTLVARYFEILSRLEVLYNLGEVGVRERITFNTGNVAFRAEVLRRLRFNPRLQVSEDGDLSYRFYKAGYRLGYNPRAIVFHPAPDTLRKFVSYYRKLAHANAALLYIHRNREMAWYVAGNVVAYAYPGLLARAPRVGAGPLESLAWAALNLLASAVMAAGLLDPRTWRRVRMGVRVQREK